MKSKTKINLIFTKKSIPYIFLLFSLILSILALYYLYQCTIKSSGVDLIDTASTEYDSNNLYLIGYLLPILLSNLIIACFAEYGSNMPRGNKNILFGSLVVGVLTASLLLIIIIEKVDNQNGDSDVFGKNIHNGKKYKYISYVTGSFCIVSSLIIGYIYLF